MYMHWNVRPLCAHMYTYIYMHACIIHKHVQCTCMHAVTLVRQSVSSSFCSQTHSYHTPESSGTFLPRTPPSSYPSPTPYYEPVRPREDMPDARFLLRPTKG